MQNNQIFQQIIFSLLLISKSKEEETDLYWMPTL